MANPMNEIFDPYEALGLAYSASGEEIRKAYFALVRQHTPEKSPDRFKQIRAAYEKLSTPEKKLETDMLRIQTISWPSLDSESSTPVPPKRRDRSKKDADSEPSYSASVPGLKNAVALAMENDVLDALCSMSDLARRHFREDHREVKF